MEQNKLKKKYGWSEEFEHFFINSNPLLKTQYRGSFRIKKHNEGYFWYYRLSISVSNRDKYLCSVEPKEKENKQSSFEYCCEILISKLQSHFTLSVRDRRFLYPYIQQYIDKIEEEGNSKVGRSSKTIGSMKVSIKDFQNWIKDKGIKLQTVPSNDTKILFKEYISHLYQRTLSRGTIKGYCEDVRYFFDWLVKDKFLDGLELFPSHPLTIEIQNNLIEQICGKKTSIIEKEFRNEYYENCYNDCIKGIRDIWIKYCLNEGKLDRIKDKNGKENQPSHSIGRDIVYFVSLLQLRGGFRIGEVLFSYRSMSVFNEFHLNNFPKEMGSFFDKTENGWVLKIRNSKGKDRDVPINDVIFSWDPPPNWIQFEVVVDENNRTHYETNIVDIIFELFPQSNLYTFPSPNYIDNPNGKRSITHYMNIFKDELTIKKGWDRYGVFSTHNLRSFFISYMIRRDDITPYQISEISGNTISVMEKYYIRENLQSKLNTFKKITQQSLIRNSKISRRNK